MHFLSLALPAYFIPLYFTILRFAESTNYDTHLYAIFFNST